jgi:hypothetical protein
VVADNHGHHQKLVKVVGFEPTKPLGNGVTARHNTPALSYLQVFCI